MLKQTILALLFCGLYFGQAQDSTRANVTEAVDASLLNLVTPNYEDQTARQLLSDQKRADIVTFYGFTRLNEQCIRQPEVPWCARGVKQEDTHRLTPWEIQASSIDTVLTFMYQSDNGMDVWNVHSAEVEAGTLWNGDCDDLTSTTLDMLHRKGQPLNRMWMVLVNFKGRGLFDHIVGVVQDDAGDYWVVGDTSVNRNVYPLSDMKHRPMGIARMDEGANWQPVTKSPVFTSLQDLVGSPEPVSNQQRR